MDIYLACIIMLYPYLYFYIFAIWPHKWRSCPNTYGPSRVKEDEKFTVPGKAGKPTSIRF